MQAEAYLQLKDTAKAISALDKSVEIDAYNGGVWAQRAQIALARSEWKDAEGYLDKAIHLLPKEAGLYINRAMTRFNQSNLRGAMADYDAAIEKNPKNSNLGAYKKLQNSYRKIRNA